MGPAASTIAAAVTSAKKKEDFTSAILIFFYFLHFCMQPEAMTALKNLHGPGRAAKQLITDQATAGTSIIPAFSCKSLSPIGYHAG